MKGTKVTHIKLSTLIRKAGRKRNSVAVDSTTTTSGATQGQSFEEDSASESAESLQKKSEQLIPILTFVAKNDDEQLYERAPPPIAPRRHLPSSSNKLDNSNTEKQSKNNLNDLKKSRNTQNISTTSHNIKSDMDDSKKSTSGDNSIEEDIEEAIPTASSSNSSEKFSPKKLDNIAIKKRNLFDIDTDDSQFMIDDEQLSGEGIAQHFFKLDKSNLTPEKNSKTTDKNAAKNSKPKLLEVPAERKSIEEANELMRRRNLGDLKQNSSETNSNTDKSVRTKSRESTLQQTDSADKSSEAISQLNSGSNPSNNSQVQTASDVRTLEKSSKVSTPSKVPDTISEKKSASSIRSQSNGETVSNVQSLEKTPTSEALEIKPIVFKINSEYEDRNKTDGEVGGPNESLTNQSTTNDVSELVDETSDNEKAQYLKLGKKNGSQDKEATQSVQSFLPRISLENSKDKKFEIPSRTAALKLDAQISLELIRNLNDDPREVERYIDANKTNKTLEANIDDTNLSDLSFDVHDISKVNKILNDTLEVPTTEETARNSISSAQSSSHEDDMDALKEKILSIKLTPKTGAPGPFMARDVSFEQTDDQHIAIKQMEKVQVDFNKDILEDITEESEKISTVGLDNLNQVNDYDNNTSNDFDSIVSLNMIQMLENKIKDLQDVVTAKDVCLNALNMQLDTAQRRESFATLESFRESFDKLPPSGRDSSSLATNSTEYRGLQEELGIKIFDFQFEIAQRDHLIEKLTDSLQQSIQTREDHQTQIDKLNTELQLLRKQMADINRKPQLPPWPNRVDQESNGQRLSEISIDLVSESDEDLERNFLTDNEDRNSNSRHSRERQPSVDFGQPTGAEIYEQQPGSQMLISKQIEQFEKYLNPDELRIFFMVQKKFDDFLSQEIAKVKGKYDCEIKILADQMEAEKHDRDLEITRLQQLLTSVKNGSTELIQLRQELDEIHAKEMEDLRMYFEKKCADLEKQYSEEIFSQHSQRNDLQSDISDAENLPHDDSPRRGQSMHRSKEGSPRKRTREELYSSPSHRQMTPTAVSPDRNRNQRKSLSIEEKIKGKNPEISIEELKSFYQEKIQEINDNNEKIIKNLSEKLKKFESKYADDEFMHKSDQITATSVTSNQAAAVAKAYAQEDQMSSYIIIDEDEMMNDGNEIAKIAAEYKRRLDEQVQLAKEDIIKELENQIQALLSETAPEDQHWPPELILLREKFTAKSQLEIAQLQIKHEEEMAGLRTKYEKQLNRKIKRQSTFDLSRDLDQIINERDGLRDLSLAFRHVTSELAKCVTLCEDDFNTTFLEEFQRLALPQHQSTVTNDHLLNITDAGDNLDNSFLNESLIRKSILETTLQKRLVPDVSTLLNVVDDPKLLSYISANPNPNITKSPSTILNSENFNLKDCIEKLKNEALMLLQLSENICQKKHLHESDLTHLHYDDDDDDNDDNDDDEEVEKHDACEEDGLRRSTKSLKKVLRTNSMNENLLRAVGGEKSFSNQLSHMSSLPPDLNKMASFELHLEEYTTTSSGGPVSELNFQVNELRNRLVKSETDKIKLQDELEATIKRNSELGVELAALRDQLNHLDSNREDYSEGYGLGEIKSPERMKDVTNSSSFIQLQEKARNLLGTPKKSTDGDTLLQLIEDFCREGDKVIEDSKKDRDDLQAQIDAADKQLKATRLLLEVQANECELEREELVKEVEKLKNLLRDKDKERTSLQNVSDEAERMEHQIKELSSQLAEYESKKDKLEIELKASIDKIFVLREIISDLETQVETKALNEHVLNEKVKELESYTNQQNHSIEKLQQEIEVLKNEIGQGYQERIINLEDALRNSRPTNEQSALLRQFGEQLRDIATTLEQKTKTLESLHQSVASISCSETPREDVSVQDRKKSALIDKQKLSTESLSTSSKGSPVLIATASPRLPSLPIEEMELVFEKLAKHTRVEEAALKRIKDLEMHINITNTAFGELQQERDVLQEKMSEQMVRISTLQTKLDEQKRRAEELQRSGSSDLNNRIHDLQNDLQNLSETLSARDKQILNLKNHLEQSKKIIDRQETELAMGINSDRSIVEKLETELKQKIEENKKLREKIKSEMINKLALPDLMETMLADKNEEIDQLREQLEIKEKELQNLFEMNSMNNNNINNNNSSKDKTNSDNGAGEAKLSARTLSDIVSISEFDEPDIIRKAVPQQAAISPLVLQPPSSDTQFPEQTMNTSKLGVANLTEKRTDDLTIFNSLPQPPTFNQPNFFATDPSIPSNLSSVPSFAPRQINFSEFVDESKLKESTPKHISDLSSNVNDEQRNLRLKLNSARQEISELKVALERVTNEKSEILDNLKKELEEKTKNLQELNTEKSTLENQIAEFDNRLDHIDELENQFKAGEENYKKLENEFIQLQLKLGQCQDCLDEKIKDISNLEKRIAQLVEENVGHKKEIENLNQNNEIELLNAKIRKLSDDNSSLQTKLDEINALNFTETIALLNNQVEILTETVEDKNEILKNYEVRFLDFEDKLKISEEKAKELENKISEMSSKNNNFEFEKLTEQLNLARTDLCEKSLLYERCLLDVKGLQSEIEKLKETLSEKDILINKINLETEKNNNNLIQEKLSSEKARNSDLQKRLSNLEVELGKIKSQQNSESTNKQLTLDEIARQVERELNYSAQLDSNILKAIESDEENNFDFKTDSVKIMEKDLLSQLQSIKEELEEHKAHSAGIVKQLEQEKKNTKSLKDETNALKAYSDKIAEQLKLEKIHSAEIQQQDSDIIEAMRIRLEEALQKEQELHKLIDEEREKCIRLGTQISTLQHSEAKKASYLLRSPPESPRKSSSGSPDFENNLVRRLKSDIELLTSQNKRERERMGDLQKLFEREKSRFESEIKDHIEYGETLKSKFERLAKEKDQADQEVEHLQEQSMLQIQEIESLTKRIVTLQEAETRRLQRREKERSESTQNLVDLQDLKSKLQNLEAERDYLHQTIDLLRNDIERSAKRESKMAEALASQSPDATIPEQFLAKMKEMNTLLRENMKDLIDERKALQRKCEDLETQLASSGSSAANNTNMELAERTNQLLGRLLRVESHRKALVHQKRYLMISLRSYQESEAKAMALINGSDSILHPKRNLFKSVALAVIAIQRMKFIAKRWQTGKRIVSKSVFTITQQKRAPINSENYYNVAPISLSPPCRDTNLMTNATNTTAINLSSPPFQLQSPTLITECVPNQHHQHQYHHLHQQQQQQQPQKFDWSRLKK